MVRDRHFLIHNTIRFFISFGRTIFLVEQILRAWLAVVLLQPNMSDRNSVS